MRALPPIETAQQKNWLVRYHFQPYQGNYDPCFLSQSKGHPFPHDRVCFVVFVRKFGDGQLAVLVPHRSLRASASER